jgi:hypothetical protein
MNYHPNGLVSQLYFDGGPRWTQQNSPHHLARPAAIFSSLTASHWQSGEYRYDGSGNIAAIGSSYFVYDKAGRVRYSAESGSGKFYFYDSFGNRTGAPGYPDPLTNRLGGAEFGYDEAGNMTREGTTSLEYDWLSSS